MIIGNGLIASSLKDFDTENFLIFASGVSNSAEVRDGEFQREKQMLIDTINTFNDRKIIYFSTCDFYDSKKTSKYLKHKFELENLIKEKCKKWIIFRVSQVIGVGNKNNLLYNFVLNIKNDQKIHVFSKYERNLITINDLKKIVSKYMHVCKNEVVNVANIKNIKVGELVEIIENCLDKESKKEEKGGENFFRIPLRDDYPQNLFKGDYYKKNINKFINSIPY